jgi:hypothetical protein
LIPVRYETLEDAISQLGEPAARYEGNARWKCGCIATHVDPTGGKPFWALAPFCAEHQRLLPRTPDTTIQTRILTRIVEGVTARCSASVDWSPMKDSVTFVLGGYAQVVMSGHKTMPSDEWINAMVDEVVDRLKEYGNSNNAR